MRVGSRPAQSTPALPTGPRSAALTQLRHWRNSSDRHNSEWNSSDRHNSEWHSRDRLISVKRSTTAAGSCAEEKSEGEKDARLRGEEDACLRGT
jgi:hypothetical protein